MTRLYPGSTVQLTVEVRDPAGNLQDVTTPKFLVAQIDATTVTEISGAGITHPSLGLYTAIFTIPSAGQWAFRFEGDAGALDAIAEETFTVNKTNLPTP